MSPVRRVAVALLASAGLAACGSNPAPVTERSEAQRVTPPIIVDSRATDRVLQSRNEPPRIVSSSGGTGRANNSGGAGRTHRVRSGDTLFSIAYQHDLDFRQLALANGLRPPYTIFVDQMLSLDVTRIPAAGTTPAIGTPVENDSTARSRGTSGSTGVIRAPIGGASNREPQWQWPHSGRLLQGFAPGNSKGLDLAGRPGDSVLAAGDGDVVYAGRGIQGNGELVIIRHNDRYLSAYAHNRALLVSEGSHVRAGDQIAELGENPDGVPMLHFEIRLDGSSVDPQRLLPRR